MSHSKTSISTGLDAIFNAEKPDRDMLSSEDKLLSISIDDIYPSQIQPRKHFSEDRLFELAESIKNNGILQPLVIRNIEVENKYEIVAGERRWRAAKLANLTEVPVIIRDVPNDSVLAFALIENIQREDLNIIEEARAYNRLFNELSLSHQDIGKRVGKSRSHITNILRLLKLPDITLNCLEKNSISMGHARALLSVPHQYHAKIIQEIMGHDLSVRQTEGLAGKLMQIEAESERFYVSKEEGNPVSHWENSLSKYLSAKVKISLNKAGKGKVIIHVDSTDEIEWLVKQIKKIRN